MKIINKILIPSLAVTSIAAATSCACGFNQDSPNPLSTDYLDIRENILYGFKEEYKFKDYIKEGHYKLTILSFKKIFAPYISKHIL